MDFDTISDTKIIPLAKTILCPVVLLAEFVVYWYLSADEICLEKGMKS